MSVKFHKPMMGTAYQWAEMSSCKRKKVGAVLAYNNRILNVAYNGTVSGENNDCELECPECSSNIQNDCSTCQGTGLISNPHVIHAEKNLIAFCAQNGIPTKDCTVYVTLSPCIECSTLMKQAGIKTVIYDEQYRDTSGIDFCSKMGLEVIKLS